jgi:hypothetical protein
MGSSSRSAIKMRLRVLGSAVTLLAIPLLTSCGDPAGPRLWPRYLLTSVDGAPLPYVLVDVVGTDGTRFRQTQLADTIQILNETDFKRTGTFYDETPLFPPGPSSTSFGGTYSRRGDTLSLDFFILSQSTNTITTVSELFVVSSGKLRVKRQVGPHCTQGSVECAVTPFVDFVYAVH